VCDFSSVRETTKERAGLGHWFSKHFEEFRPQTALSDGNNLVDTPERRMPS